MSASLKELLKKNRDRQAFRAEGNASEDFREVPVVPPLPVEKPIQQMNGKPDQCFVIIPDVHSYQRDKKAFELTMRSLPLLQEAYNVTKFIQLGDLLECGMLSTHPIASVYDRAPEYEEEVDWAVNDFWKPAMRALPNANFDALLGNHEDRLNRWLAAKIGNSHLATQIYNEMLPIELYQDLGIHVTPHGREDVKEGVLPIFNNLVCIHGWSIAKNASQAHLNYVAGGSSIIFGHTHRMQSDVRRNPLTDEYMRSYSFGSLAKVSMKWHQGRPMDHTLGFGLVFTYGNQYVIRTQEILIDGDKRTLFLHTGDVLEA